MHEHDAWWEQEFERWMAPFLGEFSHKAQRRWAPVYLRGLIAPGERKSVEPMARRQCPGDKEQLHHFVATSKWDTCMHERVLLEKADALVGGHDAHLIVDDTALVKKGSHSVGVAHQYCGQLGKGANCQALVSVTLAREEMPVPVALRLYLPKPWAQDQARRRKCAVPENVVFRPKWKIALDEVARVVEAGVTFGDVLADAGYGVCAEFRRGLSDKGLRWVLGISSETRVFAMSTRLRARDSTSTTGRPRTTREATAKPRRASDVIASLGPGALWTVAWRRGTKGMLKRRILRTARPHRRRRTRRRTPPRPRRRSVAHLRATLQWRDQVPPVQLPGRRAPRGARRIPQGALVVRAGTPADERGARPRPLRGTLLDGAAPSRPAHDDRLRLPSAPPQDRK